MSGKLRLGAEIAFEETTVGTAWINFQFSRRSRIVMKGRLNGAPHDILLDSGAESTIIDQATADTLKLASAGSTVFSDRNVISRVQLASGLTLAVPGLTVTPQQVVLVDLGPLRKMTGLQISAIMGREVFEQTIVDIDFSQARIRFLPPHDFAPPVGFHSSSLRKSASGHGRVIVVQLGATVETELEFDLGSSNPIVLQRSCWEKTALGAGTLSNSLIGGIGGIRETHLVRLPFIEVGGLRLNGVDTLLETTKGKMEERLGNGLIGMPVFSKFRTITDYRRSMLYLGNRQEAGEPAESLHLPRHRSGLRVVHEGMSLRVLLVARNSPAERSQWKAGEIIVSVDGCRVDDNYPDDERAQWHERDVGAKVKLGMSDGTTRELILDDYY